MQDEHVHHQENDQQATSARTQRLIDYLGDLWKHPHEPSAETLKRITEFVVSLPEPYRATGLKAIGEHLVNSMSLHYLDIMATFQQKAEQEGIDAEEVAATFADTLPELFQTMMELGEHVSIESINDLVNLSNITIGAYGLSHTHPAERAQRWIYSLPSWYLDDLVEEHLVTLDTTTPQNISLGTQEASLPNAVQTPGKISPNTDFATSTTLSSNQVRLPLEPCETLEAA